VTGTQTATAGHGTGVAMVRLASRACPDAHDVSIRILAGGGDGRCRGVSPRSKISMMRMGPPQHGQFLTGASGCVSAVSAGACFGNSQ